MLVLDLAPLRRRRRLVGLAALVVAGLLLALLRSHRAAPATVAAAHAEASPSAPRPRAPSSWSDGESKGSEEPAPPAAPIIDEILVEKPEVCVGEENLITVKAHAPDGADQFLHYLIGSERGAQVPLRIWKDTDRRGRKERRPMVTVFGRGNVTTTAEIPPFVVKDCKVPRVALIEARLLPNTQGEYELTARVMDRGAQGARPYVPRTFTWSFGDGTSETTTVPAVTHSYEGRDQGTLVSQYLVQVEVADDAGEKLLGRQSLELHNLAFESLDRKQIVELLISLHPRFPILSSDGVVEQGVHLRPSVREPVTIKRARVSKQYLDGTQGAPEDVDVTELLGAAEIPAEGIEAHVRLATRAERGIFSADYQLEGETGEGLAVRGSFSVMRPPAAPTREQHVPVTDPLLKAKIRAAMTLLGQPHVTQEDLARLEAEGRFADLRADTAAPPAAL